MEFFISYLLFVSKLVKAERKQERVMCGSKMAKDPRSKIGNLNSGTRVQTPHLSLCSHTLGMHVLWKSCKFLGGGSLGAYVTASFLPLKGTKEIILMRFQLCWKMNQPSSNSTCWCTSSWSIWVRYSKPGGQFDVGWGAGIQPGPECTFQSILKFLKQVFEPECEKKNTKCKARIPWPGCPALGCPTTGPPG